MAPSLSHFNWFFSTVNEQDQETPLSNTLTEAVGEWKKDLKRAFIFINELDPLFAVAWETASRERIRSELRNEDTKSNLAIVHVKATSESYIRHFMRQVDENSSPFTPSTPQSPSWSQSLSTGPRPGMNIVQLNLPEEKRHTIHGIRPPVADLLQIEPKVKDGIVDAYTGQPLSVDEMSVAKIRNDLDYMWRRRIYSDIQLAVRSNAVLQSDWELKDKEQDTMVTIFSCHRSVLMARSPYFREALGVIMKNPTSSKGGLSVLALPHKPFTPTTTEIILRFIYTGILEFPKSGFSMVDLPLPLTVHKGAEILRIPSLVHLISAHVMEMLHGLFHGHLDQSNYFQRIDGIWRNMVSMGGCVCCQCALSIPRLLRFLTDPNAKNPVLERGARRALVGLFGAGWCTNEFASLPEDILKTLLLDLKKMIVPRNALDLLCAAESGLARLPILEPLGQQTVARLFLSVRALIDRLICKQPRSCCNCEQWKELVTGRLTKGTINARQTQVGSNEIRLKWILEAISRSVENPKEANDIHEALTWFTDALVFPAVPTEEFAQMILPMKDQLVKKGAKQISSPPSSRHSSLGSSFGLSLIERTVPSSISQTSLVYSNPSSRTTTTDYGLYYRRLALSENTMSDTTSIQVVRERHSWGTLFSEI